jgi:hypothetical protein
MDSIEKLPENAIQNSHGLNDQLIDKPGESRDVTQITPEPSIHAEV